jgi:hypothetical protein
MRYKQEQQALTGWRQDDCRGGGGPDLFRPRNNFGTGTYLSTLYQYIMPGLGPSLVFAAGLAIGVGAGTFLPKKGRSEVGVLPPPPVEKYDVVKRLPTAGGSAMLQGGFPGKCFVCSMRS